MAAEHSRIAQALGRWLKSRPGVSDVQLSLTPAASPGARTRLPKPPFLRTATPSFEIRLMYKGQPRVLRYFIEQDDDFAAIFTTLRVHTNGELMVRVPDEFGSLMPNDIIYTNRSGFAPGLGDPAPNPLTRG